MHQLRIRCSDTSNFCVSCVRRSAPHFRSYLDIVDSTLLALALMLTVLLLNATRSAILGVVGGCAVASAILLVGRPDEWKRLATVLVLVAAWLLLMFVPGVRGAQAILASGPPPDEVIEAEV